MNKLKKIEALTNLIDEGKQLPVESSSDASFKTWKNSVERTLLRIYGADSLEVKQFRELRFFFRSVVMSLGGDYSSDHLKAFHRDLQIALASLQRYANEWEDDEEPAEAATTDSGEADSIERVFISHASADSGLVEELIDIIETIGLSSDQIFCTSFGEYGIELGESNFLDAIRDELRKNTLVLFVLTKQFFQSPVCLCEMGATWVLSKAHIPIIVPPLDFKDVKGVIPLTQGFKIDDPLKLNLFKEKIEALFGVAALSVIPLSLQGDSEQALQQAAEFPASLLQRHRA